MIPTYTQRQQGVGRQKRVSVSRRGGAATKQPEKRAREQEGERAPHTNYNEVLTRIQAKYPAFRRQTKRREKEKERWRARSALFSCGLPPDPAGVLRSFHSEAKNGRVFWWVEGGVKETPDWKGRTNERDQSPSA